METKQSGKSFENKEQLAASHQSPDLYFLNTCRKALIVLLKLAASLTTLVVNRMLIEKMVYVEIKTKSEKMS